MKTIKALIIVSVAFIVIACGGAEERKAAYMQKAEQSLNAGDLDQVGQVEANIALKSAQWKRAAMDIDC